MPANSAINERAVSELWRMKTYLGSTMCQGKLNHLMLLYAQKTKLTPCQTSPQKLPIPLLKNPSTLTLDYSLPRLSVRDQVLFRDKATPTMVAWQPLIYFGIVRITELSDSCVCVLAPCWEQILLVLMLYTSHVLYSARSTSQSTVALSKKSDYYHWGLWDFAVMILTHCTSYSLL